MVRAVEVVVVAGVPYVKWSGTRMRGCRNGVARVKVAWSRLVRVRVVEDWPGFPFVKCSVARMYGCRTGEG